MTSISTFDRRAVHPLRLRVEALLPGITLVAVVTAAAYGLRQLPGLSGFSPMITAIFIGMAFANFTTVPAAALPGVELFGKKMLRLAVVLLGLQLTLDQVASVGYVGMAALAGLVVGTYAFIVMAGHVLGVDAGLSRLLAAGTSICGASAIAAANATEPSNDEDVSYAVSCITLFGTIAMLLYPVLGFALGFEAHHYGFWIGSSVHEVAQVVAAGFQHSQEAGDFSVIVKLSRVLLLAPLLIAVSLLARRRRPDNADGAARLQIVPLFVAAFILAILLNSTGLIPLPIKEPFVQATPMLLTAALGALGLGTKFGALKARGGRPFLLATSGTLFIAVGSLALSSLVV